MALSERARRFTRVLKKARLRWGRRHLPRLLAAYRRRRYLEALAAKRTRRPVVLIKPTFE